MINQKIIETIKKLLALASSPNENEAKLAMQRAQEMIATHSVCLTNDIEEHVVEVKINYSKLCVGTSDFAPHIINTVGKIFGVHTVKLKTYTIISLFGYKTNIEVALHASDCIINQLNTDLRTKISQHNSFNYINDYWLAATEKIKERFKEESKIGTGMVVYDKAAELLHNTYAVGYFGRQTSFNSAGLIDGTIAGSKVQLRKGVNTQSNEVRRLQ